MSPSSESVKAVPGECTEEACTLTIEPSSQSPEPSQSIPTSPGKPGTEGAEEGTGGAGKSSEESAGKTEKKKKPIRMISVSTCSECRETEKVLEEKGLKKLVRVVTEDVSKEEVESILKEYGEVPKFKVNLTCDLVQLEDSGDLGLLCENDILVLFPPGVKKSEGK